MRSGGVEFMLGYDVPAFLQARRTTNEELKQFPVLAKCAIMNDMVTGFQRIE